MSDWIECPSCFLKHSRRPDGICPRCKSPLDVFPGQELAPAVSSDFGLPPPPAPILSTLPWEPPATRIAGAGFLANGVLALLGRFVGGAGMGGGMAAGSIVSTIIDLIIGAMLVSGNETVLVWARVRVILGAILFPILFLVMGQPLLAFTQVLFSVGFLLLLIGRPALARTAIGSVLVGLFLMLELVGLAMIGLGGASGAE